MTNDQIPMTNAGVRDADLNRIVAGRLIVEFVRQADRVGHRLLYQVAADWVVPVFQSIEGSPDERWPASPALQHLHFETQAGRRVALLVGMAGRSHWSASVSTDEAGEALIFDIACRLHSPAERLGSEYRAATWPADVPRPALEWSLDHARGATFAWQTGGDLQQLCASEIAAPVTTICWRYTIREAYPC
ncbi:MAG: hypothetical protein JSS27_21575 [Planctomycetes bacterium]|nr:hypothetical protein [Planctomycetota bacterium]